jgi:hypothetical protein
MIKIKLFGCIIKIEELIFTGESDLLLTLSKKNIKKRLR